MDPANPPVDLARMPERSSDSRVRFAAPKAGAPLTPAGRSGYREVATGGSGGIHKWACPPNHFRFASDPPAVPRYPRDCAEEALFLIRHSVCFEAGRFTLTQSSWTATLGCSRKWMSGHAASLAQPSDPRQFGKSIRLSQRFGRSFEKVQGDLRLPLTLLMMDVPRFLRFSLNYFTASVFTPDAAAPLLTYPIAPFVFAT